MLKRVSRMKKKKMLKFNWKIEYGAKVSWKAKEKKYQTTQHKLFCSKNLIEALERERKIACVRAWSGEEEINLMKMEKRDF